MNAEKVCYTNNINNIFIVAVNYKTIIKTFYPVKYNNYVEKYSEAYNLNKYLVYSVIKVESDYDADAMSKRVQLVLCRLLLKQVNI